MLKFVAFSPFLAQKRLKFLMFLMDPAIILMNFLTSTINSYTKSQKTMATIDFRALSKFVRLDVYMNCLLVLTALYTNQVFAIIKSDPAKSAC